MLGISERLLSKLKKELADQRQKKGEEQELLRTPNRATSFTETVSDHRERRSLVAAFSLSPSIPVPLPSFSTGNSDRPLIYLSQLAEDTIRYHFHL